ncbi:MAG: DUF5050 domain-containing protein [Eubacterium sp.]|jgi:cytoskeletal protein RodZ|nr:DUF5050 domain-containing protein [Eubacterium sp.]MCH4046314.1 DUF5050 domain-containing protein [Eubacterium sp.]MCH4079409.1 DUF5050 domain-containing protein [Eubacterium sp.]MCH4111041.1 DUF5050 domain-containing protein [Eubacterium sp.]MCI1307135.1 DUF5050 domain-containing protein [Eubacterium sp.]
MKLEWKKMAGVLLLALALLLTMSFTTGFTADAATKASSKSAKTTTAAKTSSKTAKKTAAKTTKKTGKTSSKIASKTAKKTSKTSSKTASKTAKKTSKTSSKTASKTAKKTGKTSSKTTKKTTKKNNVKVTYSVPASKTVKVGTSTYTLKETKTSASLISTDSATNTSKTLETLPMNGYDINNYCFISDYYNGKIYVSQNSANHGTTYTYDVAAGTWSVFMPNTCLEARIGNYFIAANPVKTPLGETEALFQFNGNGYTRLKKLGSKNCGTATAIGNYFYFVKYDAAQTQGTLYRMSANGKKMEKINTLRARSSDETFTITKITAKYCVFNVDGVNYQYTYKTRNISKMK